MSGTTAAPWSLPYPERDDAFGDYPAVAKTLAEQVADRLTNIRILTGPTLLYENLTTVTTGGDVPSTATTYGTFQTAFINDQPIFMEMQTRCSGGDGAELKWRVRTQASSTPLLFWNSRALSSAWQTIDASGLILVPSGSQTIYVQFWRATEGTAVFRARDDISSNVLVRAWQL